MKLYGLVGTGGCARDIMPLMQRMFVSDTNIKLVFVDNQAAGSCINGIAVISDSEFLASDDERYFNVGIADSRVREKIATQYVAAGAKVFSIIAENHINFGENSIAEGAVFSPFTTVTTSVVIGKFFQANMYSYVAHDCRIGDFVTFAPGVHCNGGVIIEDHAYIGSGAIIKQTTPAQTIVIGRGAVVGMGAVVTKSVEPYTTVVGNPARPV